ncbi:hypothetical protein LWM68_15845 [Niabella sp. W65]|nr:hypothetical protein [Niabella sp. W65]MCH7364099.1 hypothetical protein [Niabella sp. W65]
MEQLTKDDLLQLRMLLLSDIEKLIERKINASNKNEPQEWLRSKVIRNILGISPGTLQNLRVTGKIRYKKSWGLITTTAQILKNYFVMEKGSSFWWKLLRTIANDPRLNVWHLALLHSLIQLAYLQNEKK